MYRCPYCHHTVEFVAAGRSLRCPRPQCLSNRLWDLPVPREYVADYATHPPLLFSLIGLPGHGKTVYLESLVGSLTDLGRQWEGFSFSARQVGQLFGNVLPNATAAHQAFPPHFVTLTDVPRAGNFQLLAHDTSGENFTNDEALRRYAAYALHSKHVVLLVALVNRVKLDPQTAAEMQAAAHPTADWVHVTPVSPAPGQEPDPDGRGEYRLILGPRQLDDLLRVYREAALGQKRDLADKSLVVVLTKGDELHALEGCPREVRDHLMHDDLDPAGDAWDRLDHLSDVLEGWLRKLGYHNFIRNAQNYFHEVKFCAVSAMGSHGAVRPEPRGVMGPVLWLLRMQRPHAWVETAEGRQLYFGLEEALAAAPAGATVRLGPGHHRVPGGLVLDRPLTLAGAGMTRTFLVVSAADEATQAIEVKARGVELAELQIQAGSPADVVRVSAGSLALTDCLVGRGRADAERGIAGAGLVVQGDATATALRSGFIDNDGPGLAAIDAARVLVEECQARRNGGVGFYLGGASAVLHANQARNNDGPGIRAEGNGQAMLEDNECTGNREAGIELVTPDSRAARNRASGNAGPGLLVRSPGPVVVAKNTCTENDGSGIAVEEASAARVQENVCERNAGSGISAAAKSRPAVEKNTCVANGEHGIHVSDAAAGACRDNECRANRADGIRVDRSAEPEVVANVCEDNAADGVAVTDTARPEVDQNRCTRNGRHGVYVAKAAKPRLGRRNTCDANRDRAVNDQRSWL